jgi:hypothetical protein
MDSIVRYENVTVNNITNGTDSIGQYTTVIAPWFETRGLVHDVANSVRISERYRVYSDLVNISLNYTANTKEMVDNQNLYSITWRDKEWRITDCRESNDRQRIQFTCYRNDPQTPV